jgi:hypothetical protein
MGRSVIVENIWPSRYGKKTDFGCLGGLEYAEDNISH